jgi:hypothetical protein
VVSTRVQQGTPRIFFFFFFFFAIAQNCVLQFVIWPRTNLKNKQILGWQEVKREEEKNTRDKAVRPRGRDYVHVISDWFLNLQS